MPLTATDAIIGLLIGNGWVADGQTPTEHVRIPTRRSPVFGGIGGEQRTFGGRQRFHKPDTDLYVTVGRNSVSFYHRRDRQAVDFRNYTTGRDLSFITEAATKSATSDMPQRPE